MIVHHRNNRALYAFKLKSVAVECSCDCSRGVEEKYCSCSVEDRRISSRGVEEEKE